ncbi:MAG: phage protein Gp36 family protein [archaeon]
MQVLKAPTEDFILGEKTYIRENIESGSVEIPVESSKDFEEDQFLVIGAIGSERSEIAKIRNIIEDDVTKIELHEATDFNHSDGDPILRIRFDERMFFRSDDGRDGPYNQIGTNKIEVDQTYTEFEDTDGTTESWYKAVYYNSETNTKTSTDNSVATRAGDADRYTSLSRIVEEAGLENNDYLKKEIVSRYRMEAEAEVNASLAGKYTVPLESSSKLIQRITTLLAAGYLLKKEYSLEGDSDIGKSGTPKIERAHQLLEKIREGEYKIVDDTGVVLEDYNSVRPSSSNDYDGTVDKGELFNLKDEHFAFTDPENPTADSRRGSGNDDFYSKYNND